MCVCRRRDWESHSFSHKESESHYSIVWQTNGGIKIIIGADGDGGSYGGYYGGPHRGSNGQWRANVTITNTVVEKC